MAIDAFHKTADLLPEAMLLVSGDGVVAAANRAVSRHFRLDPAAIVGRRLADLAVDPPDAIDRYLRDCARTREMVPGSIRVLPTSVAPIDCRVEGAVFRPRGEDAEALILLRVVPKERSSSQFVALNQRIEAQANEIRRRKRVEEELREQREWLHVTLSSIGDAVIATDTSGRVNYINPIAEALTGWSSVEALGEPLERIFRIINEETRGPVENPVTKVLREGTIVGLANHTILLGRDGAEWSIDDTAAPIRRGDGEMKGVVLVFHDIGDRRALERELHERARMLAEASRRKDEFLAMLAHELRNPLAPILNTLRVLGSPSREDSDIAWATAIMERQVEHMARLIDDLLDVSRITHGKIDLKRERVDLAQIVRHAVEDNRPAIEARRHELTIDIPSETLVVQGDPTRLEQVVANLLQNAAKYTEEGGRIGLEADRQGDEVVLKVRDNGVGIAPELLSSVFDLFIQADRSLARSQGGLGIGLTLVRTIVEMHGGRVSVQSAGLGQGSEFIVHLPVGMAEVPRTTPPPAEAAATRLGPRRILVVDDSVDSARSLARLLGRWGHEVQVAHDGPSALDAVRRSLPDVVLLDIGLPGMDGYEVAQRLRSEPDLDGLMIVALTGYGQDEDRRKSRNAGFNRHLVKPVDIDALEELLGGPRR